jgi:hypothetical protein
MGLQITMPENAHVEPVRSKIAFCGQTLDAPLPENGSVSTNRISVLLPDQTQHNLQPVHAEPGEVKDRVLVAMPLSLGDPHPLPLEQALRQAQQCPEC